MVKYSYLVGLVVLLFNVLVRGRNENEVAAITRNRLFHLYENICHPLDKCNTTAHFSDRTCFCDAFCHIMNDCCYDKQLEPFNVNTLSLASLHAAMQCAAVGGVDGSGLYEGVKFYIIKSCPYGMENRTIKRLCEQTSEDQFLNLMVTSHVSGILYKNIYCSMCWEDNNVEIWQLELTCPYNMTGSMSQAPRLLNSNDLSHCVYQQLPPYPEVTRIRMCENTINTKCKETWANTLIDQHCGLHSSYIRDAKSKRIYKNFHCALCNDVVVGELRCTTIGELDLVYYPPRKTETSTSNPYINLLIQINRNGTGREIHSGETFSLPSCEEFYVMDPFQGRCRRLQCPKTHELTDAEDCDDTKSKQRAARKTLVDSFNNCSMFVYEPNQYMQIDNGTIRIKSAFHDFSLGSYLLVNGSVYICRDVIRRLSKRMFPGLQRDSFQGAVFIGSVAAALFGVLIHGVFYFLAPKLRTLRGKCLMSMDSCIIISECILLAGTSETRVRTACVVAAVFLHYFILAAFFWKNIIAYDMVTSVWRRRRKITPKNSRRFVAFCLYGWFLPATIVGISIRLDQLPALHPFVPDYAHKWCWISNEEALLVIYLAPISITLFSDLVMHLITLWDICCLIKAKSSELEPNKTDLLVHLKLYVLMGATWLLSYFGTSAADESLLWYMFSAFNAGQGVYMACIHALNPIARQDALQTLCEGLDAVLGSFRRFRRRRLKKTTQIQRKRKPTPVDV